MKNYILFTCVPYYKIGVVVAAERDLSQIQHKGVRFVQDKNTKRNYLAYVPKENGNIPTDRFNLVDIVNRSDLEKLLPIETSEESLPEEIRVVCPTPIKDVWGVFFKR